MKKRAGAGIEEEEQKEKGEMEERTTVKEKWC